MDYSVSITIIFVSLTIDTQPQTKVSKSRFVANVSVIVPWPHETKTGTKFCLLFQHICTKQELFLTNILKKQRQ